MRISVWNHLQCWMLNHQAFISNAIQHHTFFWNTDQLSDIHSDKFHQEYLQLLLLSKSLKIHENCFSILKIAATNVTLVLPSFSQSYFYNCQVLAYSNKTQSRKSCQESRVKKFQWYQNVLENWLKVLWVVLSSQKLSWLENFPT